MNLAVATNKVKLPVDVKVYHAFVLYLGRCSNDGVIVATSKLIAATALQCLRKVWMLYTFSKWAASRKATQTVQNERMAACKICDVSKTIKDELYCGLCGCPDWKLSRLKIKNGRRGHNCPRGLHAGSYVTMQIKGKGCGSGGGGCGDGKQQKQTSIIRGGVADALKLATDIEVLKNGNNLLGTQGDRGTASRHGADNRV